MTILISNNFINNFTNGTLFYEEKDCYERPNLVIDAGSSLKNDVIFEDDELDFDDITFTTKQTTEKKEVKFADECGQDLVQIREFEKSDIYADLDFLLFFEEEPQIKRKPAKQLPTKPAKLNKAWSYSWVASFIQPASIYSRFKHDLSVNKVKLANVLINEAGLMTGIIRVINLSYEKLVFVRLSSDKCWTSYRDFNATYKCQSEVENNCDEFSFKLQLPSVRISDTMEMEVTSSGELYKEHCLEFVVGYLCGSGASQEDHWDNNNNSNYRLDYCRLSIDNMLTSSLTPSSTPISIQYSSATQCTLNQSNITSTSPSLMSSNSPSALLAPPLPLATQGSATQQYTTDYKPDFSSYHNDFTNYRVWTHFSDNQGFY